MDPSLTLQDMLNRAHGNPARDIGYRLGAAETGAAALVQIERALALAVTKLCENRKYKQDQSEDHRTVNLVEMLQMAGLPANHDAKIGGHTDISIRLFDDFLWIAEAKNWRGCAWAWKGFRQLLTRYSPGTPGADRHAMILYMEGRDAGGCLQKWQTALTKQSRYPSTSTDLTPLLFQSETKHLGTGMTMQCKHVAVPLYYEPDDD